MYRTIFSGVAAHAADGAKKGGDGLPDPGVVFVKGQTAIVITDPQIDFLSPDGVAWPLVGKSVTKNGTVENIEKLMKIAGEKDILLVISPHFYAPQDLTFKHSGALEHAMHGIKMFESDERLDQAGFKPSTGPYLCRNTKNTSITEKPQWRALIKCMAQKRTTLSFSYVNVT